MQGLGFQGLGQALNPKPPETFESGPGALESKGISSEVRGYTRIAERLQRLSGSRVLGLRSLLPKETPLCHLQKNARIQKSWTPNTK